MAEREQELFDLALAELRELLGSEDESIRLQAAKTVTRVLSSYVEPRKGELASLCEGLEGLWMGGDHE